MPAPHDDVIDRKVFQARTAHTITKALADLPGSADEIAEHFTNSGITGHPVGGNNCPVVQYLKAALAKVGIGGRHVSIYVGPYTIVVGERRMFVSDRPTWTQYWNYSTDPRDRGTAYYMPKAVVDFIANFDDNKYPHLDSARSVQAVIVDEVATFSVEEFDKLVAV